MFAPIALFVFNRPDHTQRTLAALARNPEASQTELHIFCDGPRNEAEQLKTEQVRNLCRDFKGFKKIQLFEQDMNHGLANSLIHGISQVLENYERVIVLEDDIVTSPAFLTYMNGGLEKYASDERVASIHGYVYPIAGLPPSFFIRGADCWGWATWKRAWKHFEPDSKKLLQELVKRGLTADFDFGRSYPYVQMLKDQIDGRVNSWAIRWYASAYLNEMYTLYPGQTLVHNIGLDESGTHTGFDDRFFSEMGHFAPKDFPSFVSENPRDRNAFRDYFLSLKPWHRRLAWRIRHAGS
jgi:hypothetical protein